MKLNYRPEIDGLRAIAVLSVVFYHAKFSIFGEIFLQGSFLGVDIFFVISGYLITKQILLDLKLKNKFSFREFYIRRIKRLIPTLLFVTFFTLVIGGIILLPFPLKLFVESLIYQLGFISNFNFWHHYHFGYMAEDALRLPFLHTWSLSLEEQFYLIFPIFIILIYKYFKKYLFLSIFVCFVFSLGLSHISSTIYKSLTFYMLPFRGWELLAGSLVAYLKVYPNKNYLNENNFFSKPLIYLSFFTILFYLFFFNVNLLHPSFYTFFLILAVSTIIWFDKSRNLITKLSSAKLLIAFGLISYSLYLWHYPLFAFARHFYGPYFEEIVFIKLLIILISIILSIFTFYFIERPFRKRNLSTKKLYSFLMFFLVLILVPSLFILKNKGFEERIDLTNYQKQMLQSKEISTITKKNRNDSFKNNDKKKVLIIGNSHAKDFYATLSSNEYLAKDYDINYFFTQVYCLKDILTTGKNLCQRTFNRNKLKTLNDIKNFNNADVLVLKTKWNEESLKSIEKIIKYLKKTNKKIILVSDFASFENKAVKPYLKPKNFNKNFQQKIYYLENFPLERYILENDKFPNRIEISKIEKQYYSLLDKKILENNIFLKQVAKKYNIIFLDHISLICDQNKKSCIVSTPNKKIIHKDSAGHITRYGAEFLGRKIYANKWFRFE